jgi:hypothetical protein
MTRRQIIMGVAAAAGAAAAAVWLVQQRHVAKRTTPDWKDPQQPVEGTGGQPAEGLPGLPSPAAAWNAVRPGSPRMGAGSVVMRQYGANLVDDPESLVR